MEVEKKGTCITFGVFVFYLQFCSIIGHICYTVAVAIFHVLGMPCFQTLLLLYLSCQFVQSHFIFY